MSKETFRISARVILFNEEKQLLIMQCAKPKKEEGWDFPGGHVDKGEQIEEAAIREVQEETGLDIDELHLLKTIIREENNKCLVYYFAYAKSESVILSREHKDYKWISTEDLEHYKFFYESSIPIAKDAFLKIKK